MAWAAEGAAGCGWMGAADAASWMHSEKVWFSLRAAGCVRLSITTGLCIILLDFSFCRKACIILPCRELCLQFVCSVSVFVPLSRFARVCKQSKNRTILPAAPPSVCWRQRHPTFRLSRNECAAPGSPSRAVWNATWVPSARGPDCSPPSLSPKSFAKLRRLQGHPEKDNAPKPSPFQLACLAVPRFQKNLPVFVRERACPRAAKCLVTNRADPAAHKIHSTRQTPFPRLAGQAHRAHAENLPLLSRKLSPSNSCRPHCPFPPCPL
jgi:hypothetical protein